MIQIHNSELQKKLIAIKDEIVVGFGAFSDSWLEQTDAKVIASENLEHLTDEEALSLSNAFATCYPGELYAVSMEAGPGWDDVILCLNPNIEDFIQLNDAYFARIFLLFSSDQKCAVLFNPVGDYKLLAGTRNFLELYWGDAKAQKELFIEFMESQFEFISNHQYRTALIRASEYMNWI